MKITICGSIAFYEEMEKIKKDLENIGHNVMIPLLPVEVPKEFGAGKKVYFGKFVEDNGTQRMGSRHVIGISDISKRHKSRFIHILLQKDPKALELLKALKSDLDENHYRRGGHRA